MLVNPHIVHKIPLGRYWLSLQLETVKQAVDAELDARLTFVGHRLLCEEVFLKVNGLDPFAAAVVVVDASNNLFF